MLMLIMHGRVSRLAMRASGTLPRWHLPTQVHHITAHAQHLPPIGMSPLGAFKGWRKPTPHTTPRTFTRLAQAPFEQPEPLDAMAPLREKLASAKSVVVQVRAGSSAAAVAPRPAQAPPSDPIAQWGQGGAPWSVRPGPADQQISAPCRRSHPRWPPSLRSARRPAM